MWGKIIVRPSTFSETNEGTSPTSDFKLHSTSGIFPLINRLELCIYIQSMFNGPTHGMYLSGCMLMLSVTIF